MSETNKGVIWSARFSPRDRRRQSPKTRRVHLSFAGCPPEGLPNAIRMNCIINHPVMTCGHATTPSKGGETYEFYIKILQEYPGQRC